MNIEKQKVVLWAWEILCLLIAITLGRVFYTGAYDFFLNYLNLGTDDLFLLLGVSFFAPLIFVRKKLNFKVFCRLFKFTDKE